MTNEEYFDYIINREEIMAENKETKKNNYLLISLLIIASAIIATKIIDERKIRENKRFINSDTRL